MKFFIPYSDSDEQATRVYSSIKEHLGLEEASSRRVRSLCWKHDGKHHEAVVGEVTSFNNEPVIAILYKQEDDLYFVCTPNRGVARGEAILAGGWAVTGSNDFEKQ